MSQPGLSHRLFNAQKAAAYCLVQTGGTEPMFAAFGPKSFPALHSGVLSFSLSLTPQGPDVASLATCASREEPGAGTFLDPRL